MKKSEINDEKLNYSGGKYSSYILFFFVFEQKKIDCYRLSLPYKRVLKKEHHARCYIVYDATFYKMKKVRANFSTIKAS